MTKELTMEKIKKQPERVKTRKQQKGVKKQKKAGVGGGGGAKKGGKLKKSSGHHQSQNSLKVIKKKIIARERKTKTGKKFSGISGELLNALLDDPGSCSITTTIAKAPSQPLKDFQIIKWKIKSESEAVHHLFVKKHTVPLAELTTEKPMGKTLLCHNVPPYFSESHLKQIFRSFGDIGKIYIRQQPTVSPSNKFDHVFPLEKDVLKGFKVAYIIYKDSKFVDEIMELNPDDVEPIVLTSKPVTGVQRWMDEYNKKIVGPSDLEKSVQKFMQNFDKMELKRKEMEKNGGEPDEEGWVTVTRTGKRASGGLVRSETMEARLKAKKRRQDKELMNFTPAQIKETKMKQLMELKKKFEEDKQRVALLKQKRKFKPF